MSTHPMSVVDSPLRVHGIEGLRVIDASGDAGRYLDQHQRPHDHDRRKGRCADQGRRAPAAGGAARARGVEPTDLCLAMMAYLISDCDISDRRRPSQMRPYLASCCESAPSSMMRSSLRESGGGLCSGSNTSLLLSASSSARADASESRRAIWSMSSAENLVFAR
jgi:GMC oxidoreductase